MFTEDMKLYPYMGSTQTTHYKNRGWASFIYKFIKPMRNISNFILLNYVLNTYKCNIY